MTAKTTATLSEVLRVAIESYIDGLHIALPSRVLKYDATTQTVTLQPELKRLITKIDGTTLEESLPAIPNVPVAFPRVGDWFLSFPVAVDDKMFAIFSSRSLDEWRSVGTDVLATDPRVHPLNGAVAIPCNLYPSSLSLSSVHTDNLVVGKDDGAKVYVKSDSIALYEENPSEFIALATKTFNEINALRTTVNTLVTAYNAHTHAETGITTSTPSVPASAPAAVNSVASSKVKST